MATYLEKIRGYPLIQRLNQSLRAKLVLAFAIVAALSLIVGVTAILSVNVSNVRLQQLVVTNQQEPQLWQRSVATFVQARTEDISFLRVYPERGFSFANIQYVRSWERQIENLLETLTELKTLTDQEGNPLISAEEVNEIDRIIDVIGDYVAKFNATVTFIEFNQGGDTLSGNIGQTVAALEAEILPLDEPELQKALLRMRHVELNFFLSGEQESVIQHEAAVKAFRALVEESDIDGIVKARTIAELAAYKTKFDELVNSNAFIEGNINDYQALAASAEETLRNKLAEAVAESAAAETAAVNTIRQSITLLATLSIITFVASLIAAFTISQGINIQISNILAMFRQLQTGDFSARAAITSRDELGQIGESINGVLDNNAELIQTQDETTAIQTSITRLLSDITTAAEGDLTAEAEVTDNITGSIADSFNFMVEQLREVITQVRDASLQVSSSANEIQTTAEHLSQGSQQQSEQILDTTSAIDEMSISIQRVSDNAALCATVSEQARANSDLGSEAVQQTIVSMQQIQAQVNRTSDQLTRLRTGMREIDNVVRLINSIAERTSILAINASIQAASAGTASQSFGLVASEVDALAQRSSEATQQIARLVSQIQQRANLATNTIGTTKLEVTQGINLANTAGDRLLEIEVVADRLAELIQQISRAAKQQARGSETIAQSMNDISQVTQQNATGTQEATVSIRNLAQLADELRASVSTFKVSAETVGAFSAD